MILSSIHWREAMAIRRRSRLVSKKSILLLTVYYFISVINALFDGISLVLLVDLISGGAGLSNSSPVLAFIKQTLEALSVMPDFKKLYSILIGLFILRVIMIFAVTALDGYLEAKLRQRVQETGFTQIMKGDWEFLRNIRVGERVGAITEESTNVARYFMSIIRALYSFLSSIVLVAMAMVVSLEVTLLFAGVGIPALLALKYLFNLQAKVAEKLVEERQGFYATITERINGLFQIKVEGNADHHISKGKSHQEKLTALEIKWWVLRAYIYAFNVLLPVLALLAFQVWAYWKGQALTDIIYLLAGVGIVGARALTQVNQLTNNLGNITGFSGSIPAVYGLFTIPEEPNKDSIGETIKSVELNKVSYFYGENTGIDEISLTASIGRPLIIMGPSGSGKTTLANIISGVYRPNGGKVFYLGLSGEKYQADKYRPRVGYLTQDIHLFHGSVKENLAPGDTELNDESLWECLGKAGAQGLVSKMGGLDAEIAEAGRSLSGGEKRRLGIARVLTGAPDILILDEVTVGLDEAIKSDLIKTIHDLSRSLVVIVITHDVDVAGSDNSNVFKFSPAPMKGDNE